MSMALEAKRVLRSAALFSDCRDDDLDIVAELSGTVVKTDGEAVFAAGDPSDRMFIVASGEVVIRQEGDDGQAVDIARFLPGDGFGELDWFTGELRSASAVADGEVRLISFPDRVNGLEYLAEAYPGTHARLLHAFLVQISARIRGVNALVKENSPLVQELKKQVYVDKLTGLFNRTYFDETLDRLLRESTGSCGLLMMKPDNFKNINDRFGHETGDAVLVRVAEVLRDFVPDRDMLFRYMGNENALIVPHADRSVLRDRAAEIREFLNGLDLSSLTGDAEVRLSVSIGLALAPDHGGDAASLVDAAHPLTLEGRRRGGNLILFPEDSDGT